MQIPPLTVIASWPAPNYVDPPTRGWANVIMNIALYPLVCFALIIRVYTRLRVTRSFGWDDWLIILAFFPATAFSVIVLISELKFGWNRHTWDLPPANIMLGLKILISTQILFTTATTLTKCSMLLLVYRMVSRTSGLFPKIVLGAIALVALQGTLFCFMVVFQCRPISAYWTLSLTPQNCISQRHHLLAASIIGTTTDLLTTLLPLPTIIHLRLPFQQQLIILLLFSGGLTVTAAGCVRTWYTWRATVSYDGTWETWAVWFVSSIELYIGIICASLPATKKFFTTYAPRIMGSRSSRSGKSKSSTVPDIELSVVEIVPPPASKPKFQIFKEVRISINRTRGRSTSGGEVKEDQGDSCAGEHTDVERPVSRDTIASIVESHSREEVRHVDSLENLVKRSDSPFPRQ